MLNDRTDRYGGSIENRARLTIEILEGIRAACGPDFQIGWRLSVERYGLRLEELRDITAAIFDRELIDYLDLALWDSAQIVQEGSFRGKSMLSIFTEIPRKGVRLGVAGKIMSAQRASQLLDEGCDFILVGRASILQRDFPLQVKANPLYRRATGFGQRDGVPGRCLDL